MVLRLAELPRAAVEEAPLVVAAAAAGVLRQLRPAPWQELPTVILTSAVFGICRSVLEQPESKDLIRMRLHRRLAVVVALRGVVELPVADAARAAPGAAELPAHRQQLLVTALLAEAHRVVVVPAAVVARLVAQQSLADLLPAEHPAALRVAAAVAGIRSSILPTDAFPTRQRRERSSRISWSIIWRTNPS
jgi:hypothetical protein